MRFSLAALALAMVAAVGAFGGAASEPRVTASPITITNLPLGVVAFANGKAVNLSVSIGSGAFRAAADPEGRIWVTTDRGPVVECATAKAMFGADEATICPGVKGGEIVPLPGFVPSIYAVDIGADNVARLNEFLPLRGTGGKPVSGLPLPQRNGGAPQLSVDGKILPGDPSGIDPEALVRLSDGSFIVAEEFGPSLLRVSPAGVITQRIMPNGLAEDIKDAIYPVTGGLPSLLRRRNNGQGFEGLALMPDEKSIVALLDRPLAGPGGEVARASLARLYRIDLASGTVSARFAYPLDAAETAPDENGNGNAEWHIAEAIAIDNDRLIVLERSRKAFRLYRVLLDPGAALPAAFDDEATQPALEQLEPDQFAAHSVRPLQKSLILDSNELRNVLGRFEAAALLSPREILVINDNAFAIDGTKTQMFRILFAEESLR